MALWATVDVKRVSFKRPEAAKHTTRLAVAPVHQQALLDAVEDIVPKLQEVGYAVTKAVVPQPGHGADHDLVLEYRKVGHRCQGVFSGELKLRTTPSDREKMRSDCSKLFRVACGKSKDWLGQLIIVAEVTSQGAFLLSKAELIMRDRPRSEALNLWGYAGRPCLAPPRVVLPVAKVLPRAALPARMPPPPPPVAASLATWASVWPGLPKRTAWWTTEDVVQLKTFLFNVGLTRLSTHASKVITQNKFNALQWVETHEYGRGANPQGGAAGPWMVRKSSLKAYYNHLVATGQRP
jgi:hypothetical protein